MLDNINSNESKQLNINRQMEDQNMQYKDMNEEQLIKLFSEIKGATRVKLFAEILKQLSSDFYYRGLFKFLVDFELKYVNDHFKTVKSMKRQFTDRRNAIKEIDPSLVLFKLVRSDLRLNKEQQARFELEQKATRDAVIDNKVIIYDYKKIVHECQRILTESNKFGELLGAIAILTGRRLAEILFTGEFKPDNGMRLLFKGQLKKGKKDHEKTIDGYSIPVLATPHVLCDAIAKIRSSRRMLKFIEKGKTYKDIGSSKLGKPGAIAANKIINEYPGNHVNLDFKQIRGFYFNICCDIYKPVQRDAITFGKEILGHGDVDSTIGYLKFVVVEGNKYES